MFSAVAESGNSMLMLYTTDDSELNGKATAEESSVVQTGGTRP